jgi:seryl-tRNA synthetase
MPIDVNALRVDRGGDPERVRNAQKKRYKPDDIIDQVLILDQRWREQITRMRDLRTQVNDIQKRIAPKRKQGLPCESEETEKKRLEEEIKHMEKEHVLCEGERDDLIRKLGNEVDDSVPVSQNEDEDNNVVRVWPLPDGLQLPCQLGKISYPLPEVRPLTHDDLLWRIGGYDQERGSKVAGGRGYFLCDVGVLLNQALINFALAFLRERRYSPIQVPFFMKKDLMAGIAQLADFDEQLYKVTTGNKSEDADDTAEKYLIATSEQPLCAYHHKEILDAKDLPLRYAGVSTCFRKEVGKANMENRGIFRVHQFEKVEQFCLTVGDVTESKKMHQEMLCCAEDFHKALGIPYRVVNIVSGELNDAAMIKYDLEGWFPGQGRYRELVSCSNCTDFQARAMDVRYREHKVEVEGVEKKSQVKLSHVHMLNSTLTATGRGICCILETYQTSDGVNIPEALVPFMGGMTFLPFVRPPRTADGVPQAMSAKKRDIKPTKVIAVDTASATSNHVLTKELLKGNDVQVDALEEVLSDFSYVNGFQPSQLDVKIFLALQGVDVNAGRFPNVTRWLAHIASFTPRQRIEWK